MIIRVPIQNPLTIILSFWSEKKSKSHIYRTTSFRIHCISNCLKNKSRLISNQPQNFCGLFSNIFKCGLFLRQYGNGNLSSYKIHLYFYLHLHFHFIWYIVEKSKSSNSLANYLLFRKSRWEPHFIFL